MCPKPTNFRVCACYRQWFEYRCAADSWLILYLKGRPGSSPSGFVPEMLAFGHLLLLTVALWPYGRAEPECDEPVSATSSALLQQGTQHFYFKQPGFVTLEKSAASMHWWPCQCTYRCTSKRKNKQDANTNTNNKTQRHNIHKYIIHIYIQMQTQETTNTKTNTSSKAQRHTQIKIHMRIQTRIQPQKKHKKILEVNSLQHNTSQYMCYTESC